MAFKSLHNAMNNLSKQLLGAGVGAEKQQARVITEDEESELWRKGIIGPGSPKSLVNAMFYYCGILFCLRGGSEHRELKYSQLKLEQVADPADNSKTIKCVTYREFGSKNHPGLVHQVHLNNKVVKQYANPGIGERCFVALFELYTSKLPKAAIEKDMFYCKPKTKYEPDDDVRYCNSPLGTMFLVGD